MAEREMAKGITATIAATDHHRAMKLRPSRCRARVTARGKIIVITTLNSMAWIAVTPGRLKPLRSAAPQRWGVAGQTRDLDGFDEGVAARELH